MHEQTNPEGTENEALAEEELVQHKVDKDGQCWKKVYFGGGGHFRNWLSQCVELRGEENVDIEEIDARGLQCFEGSGEKMYRIWIKDNPLIDR